MTCYKKKGCPYSEDNFASLMDRALQIIQRIEEQ